MARRRRDARQFVVIGLGRFGSSVVRTLASMGYEVLAVDVDEERVNAMATVATHAVQADGTDESAMRAIGVRNFDVAVVSIGDLQANILTTMILRELGVKEVVAKALSELHGKVLERVGADMVIYPERDMGVRVAHNLVSGNLVDYLELAPGVSIVEVVAKRRFVGKTLRELNLRARFGINVLAIRKADGVNLAPGADDVIKEGDILVAMGRDEDLEALETQDDDEA